jgi:hypothetical protein
MEAGAQPARAVAAEAVLAAQRRPAARRHYRALGRHSVPPLAATAAARGLACCRKAVETAVAPRAERGQAADRDRATILARVLESATDLVIVPERGPVLESGIGLEPAVVQVLAIAPALEAAQVLATVPG